MLLVEERILSFSANFKGAGYVAYIPNLVMKARKLAIYLSVILF